MIKLTKAEEEIMQYIWRLERCTVSQILDEIEAENSEKKRPPHSSVSSFVRLLEDKGFVGHKAYGKTYEYFALINKDDYGKSKLNSFISDYFNGSAQNLVSFLVKDEAIDADELKELLDRLDAK